MTKKLMLASLIGFAVILFVLGAMMQGAHMNTDMSKSDQSAYMAYAKKMAETNLEFVGGRARMPLYPAMMSFFYQQGMSDEEYFECGKKVGILLGLAGLVLVFILFRQAAGPLDALTATLVTMFTVFIYKAPYFHGAMLFYLINFLLFFFLLALVQKPKISTATIAGVVGGLCYLSKASAFPAIVLISVVLLVRGAIEFFRWRKDEGAGSGGMSQARFVAKNVSYVLVFLFCFLLIVAPYISNSKERFGRYFYNANSTFYVWYDSWDEVDQGTRAFGDRYSWPDVPEEQLPSMQKYLREHSLGQILWRIGYGSLVVGYVAAHSYGYGEFLIVYLLMLGLLLVQKRGDWVRASRQKVHPATLLFLACYFGGYILLYAWFTPISSGNRFVLSLFLPAMFVLLSVLSFAQTQQQSIDFFGRKIFATSVSPVVLLYLVIYLLITFPQRIMTMYGGY